MYEHFEEMCHIHGVTAYKVAKETGVSTATLSSWKQGKYVPKEEKLKLLADYFKCSVNYLRDGKEISQPETDFILSPLEKNLIRAFRISNPITQDNILKLLDIPAVNKKSAAV